MGRRLLRVRGEGGLTCMSPIVPPTSTPAMTLRQSWNSPWPPQKTKAIEKATRGTKRERTVKPAENWMYHDWSGEGCRRRPSIDTYRRRRERARSVGGKG
jgi:hypothetical protein